MIGPKYNKNICCGHSLELSRRDGSSDGVTAYVLKEYYGKLSLLPLLIWRSVQGLSSGALA